MSRRSRHPGRRAHCLVSFLVSFLLPEVAVAAVCDVPAEPRRDVRVTAHHRAVRPAHNLLDQAAAVALGAAAGTGAGGACSSSCTERPCGSPCRTSAVVPLTCSCLQRWLTVPPPARMRVAASRRDRKRRRLAGAAE